MSGRGARSQRRGGNQDDSNARTQPVVTWVKTDAGRAEIQARALVKERALRNLLLVIDGRTPAEVLLVQLAGIAPRDFLDLQALGLIAPAGGPGALGGGGGTAAAGAAEPDRHQPPAAASSAPLPVAPVEPAADEAGEPVPLDYAQFTAALTRLISKELGLRGFMLTLAVEKASSPQELLAVAERAIDQIRDRRGEASADAASRQLFGG